MAQINQEFINQVKEVISNQPIPPQYDPTKWEEKRFNCYAYAMRICMDLSQYYNCTWPGFISEGAKNNYKDTKKSLLKHFKKDCESLGLKVLPTTISEEIQKNEYKIAVYLYKGRDFHFARQDSNGNWSEKDGWDNEIEILEKEEVTKDQGEYKSIVKWHKMGRGSLNISIITDSEVKGAL